MHAPLSHSLEAPRGPPLTHGAHPLPLATEAPPWGPYLDEEAFRACGPSAAETEPRRFFAEPSDAALTAATAIAALAVDAAATSAAFAAAAAAAANIDPSSAAFAAPASTSPKRAGSRSSGSVSVP